MTGQRHAPAALTLEEKLLYQLHRDRLGLGTGVRVLQDSSKRCYPCVRHEVLWEQGVDTDISIYNFDFRRIGQPHALTAFPSRKEFPVTMKSEFWWPKELLQRLWRK